MSDDNVREWMMNFPPHMVADSSSRSIMFGSNLPSEPVKANPWTDYSLDTVLGAPLPEKVKIEVDEKHLFKPFSIVPEAKLDPKKHYLILSLPIVRQAQLPPIVPKFWPVKPITNRDELTSYFEKLTEMKSIVHPTEAECELKREYCRAIDTWIKRGESVNGSFNRGKTTGNRAGTLQEAITKKRSDASLARELAHGATRKESSIFLGFSEMALTTSVEPLAELEIRYANLLKNMQPDNIRNLQLLNINSSTTETPTNHNKENSMSNQINVTALAGLVAINKKDDLSDFLAPGVAMNDELKAALIEAEQDDRKKAVKDAAQSIRALIAAVQATKEVRVAKIREVRANEKNLLDGLKEIERAHQYANETSNYLPLLCLVNPGAYNLSHIDRQIIGAAIVVPTDWQPAAKELNPDQKATIVNTGSTGGTVVVNGAEPPDEQA